MKIGDAVKDGSFLKEGGVIFVDTTKTRNMAPAVRICCSRTVTVHERPAPPPVPRRVQLDGVIQVQIINITRCY
jgi:hypothetical protein